MNGERKSSDVTYEVVKLKRNVSLLGGVSFIVGSIIGETIHYVTKTFETAYETLLLWPNKNLLVNHVFFHVFWKRYDLMHFERRKAFKSYFFPEKKYMCAYPT